MQKNIQIILVNPSHPGNIGATARAMKNMGLSQLRLVKPQRSVDEQAFARAAGADDILHQARYFDTLEEAIADCQIVFGTSGRGQVPDVEYLTTRQAAHQITHQFSDQQVGILFGREHAGLTNEELLQCHCHVHIPCNPDFSSLNLGQAVQVFCYEIFTSQLAEDYKPEQKVSEYDGFATQLDIERFFEHLGKTLTAIDFHDPQNPRRLMPKLKALFNRTKLKQSEVNILRGILSAIDKKTT